MSSLISAEQTEATDSPPTAKRPLLRRRALLIGCLATLLFTGWFGQFAYQRVTYRPTPRPEYWDEQLMRLDPPGPNAVSMKDAETILYDTPWTRNPATAGMSNQTEPEFPWGQWKASDPRLPKLGILFESAEFISAKEKIRQLAAVGWQPDFSLDQVIVTPWIRYSGWNAWLLAHSRWIRQTGHDPDGAIEDWLDCFRLARHYRRPKLAQRIWQSEHLYAFSAQELILAARESPGIPNLRAFVDEVDRIVGPLQSPREMLVGNRLEMQSLLEFIYVRESGDWLSLSDSVLHVHTAIFGRAAAPSRLWNLTSPFFHDLASARRDVDDYCRSFDGCVDLISSTKAEDVARGEHHAGLSYLDGLERWITLFYFSPSGYYAARTHLEGALGIMAVEQYRRDHGEFPASLAAVVPQYLSRVPIDYADRKPMRYRRTDKGYVLYSIGSDGIDQGGVETDHTSLANQSHKDWVYSTLVRKAAGP